MTKFTYALLSVAAITFVTTPAFAAEQTGGKKTKEITELVGYNVTEETSLEGQKEARFRKMDANADGSVNFKEFQNYSVLDNEYEIFSEIDVNQSKSIDFAEFSSYEQGKGKTEFESELHGKASVKGTNLKSRTLVEKHYYVPVEPKIVSETDINPASGEEPR
jgi:Ca2+-binding EF-hand superfamily protein